MNVKHWMNVRQRIGSWTVNQSWWMNESSTANENWTGTDIESLRENQKLHR